MIPLMLWKPQEPVYPKLIKTTVEGLSIEETKGIRKRGLAIPALTKLGNFYSVESVASAISLTILIPGMEKAGRNGYYGNLVSMVRDAFLVGELVRIDCTGLDKSDHKKITVKLRVISICMVTFSNCV